MTMNINISVFFLGGAHLGHTIPPQNFYIFHFDFYHAIMDLVGEENFRQWQMGLKFLQLLTECLKPPWWALALPSAVAPGHGKRVSYIRFGRDGLVSKSTMNLW